MLIACDPPYQQCIWQFRVWKGILGIRDLTKIPCGIRENEKYLDGIRDLTATREAGFAKIWDGKRDLVACLSGIWEIVTTQISVMAAKANQPGERIYQSKGPAFAEISLFSCIFGKEKTKFGIAMKKVRDAGFP